MCGSVFSASSPQAVGSVGTSRQPASSSSSRFELRGELRARGRLLRRVAAQEHEARGELRRELDARLLRHGAQEFLGTFQQQAAAVAGFAVASRRRRGGSGG